ncbi:MAG: phosphotransferase [Dehalococcoidia bacterium]
MLARHALSGAWALDSFEASTRNDNPFVVDGARARYVLRRFRRNPEPARIEFQLHFQQHLLDAGLPVPAIVPARGGDRMVETLDGRWALFSYLEREYFDFERPAQIDEAAQTLARFHLAGEPFGQPEPPHELKLDVRRYWTHGAQVTANLR